MGSGNGKNAAPSRCWVRVAALLGGLVLAGCRGDEAPVAADSQEIFANQDPQVGYVGVAECRPCHLDIATTYASTGMGRSFYPMSPQRAVEDFTRDNELVIEKSGLRYRMTERDGKYYQRQYLVDSRGRELVAAEHELRWVVGSNNHSRSYLLSLDGRMFQAPVCWYPQASKWDLCPGFERKNDHFAREIGSSCLFCHNAAMKAVAGERNLFEDPIPHGIDCERCHGPGQLHVQRWSNGRETPTGKPDPTIVHPRRLSAERRLHLCSQCHLADAVTTKRVLHPGKEFPDYRPGQPISAVAVSFSFAEKTQYDFGLSSQVDRLILSRCWKESQGKLECLTCHNPHVSVYHEERPADLFRRKCLGCHVEADCTADLAQRRATPELADDCVACHMRRAEPDDQRYTEFTDHWIRRDIDLDHRDERESYELEPVFPHELQALGEADRAFYLARANYIVAEDKPMGVRQELWNTVVAGFQKTLELGRDDAPTRFYLGKTYLLQGRLDDAIAELGRALEHEPAHGEARFTLGQALASKGDIERARDVFQRMLDENPRDVKALAEYGRAAWMLGRSDEALDVYRKAIEQEPWTASLHLNRAAVLASTRRFSEATDAALDAARLDPDAPEVWNFIANAAREARRPELAEEARRILDRLRPKPEIRQGG